jgi:copper homeostasis protein
MESVDILIKLGIERVLTSGQKSSAGAGFEMLKKLRIHANGQLVILPGGGIDAGNVKTFKAVGFKEVHASASNFRKLAALSIDPSVLQSVPMHNTKTLDQHEVGFSDIDKIKALLKAVQ